MKLSQHVQNDRLDRLAYIAEHVGWGTELYQWHDTVNNTFTCMTSTGVMLIRSGYDREYLVTAYLADREQMYFFFRACGYTQVPPNMERMLRKNRVHIKKQYLVGL